MIGHEKNDGHNFQLTGKSPIGITVQKLSTFASVGYFAAGKRGIYFKNTQLQNSTASTERKKKRALYFSELFLVSFSHTITAFLKL